MSDTLLEFLRSGALGMIRLGMSSEELRAQLGDPDDIAAREQIWLFGSQVSVNIQVPLVDDHVHGIWVYFLGREDVSKIPQLLDAGE